MPRALCWLASSLLSPWRWVHAGKDLNSYTVATLMAFVKGEEAPSGLVPSWLDETGFRRRLRDYQSPTLAKKAK